VIVWNLYLTQRVGLNGYGNGTLSGQSECDTRRVSNENKYDELGAVNILHSGTRQAAGKSIAPTAFGPEKKAPLTRFLSVARDQPLHLFIIDSPIIFHNDRFVRPTFRKSDQQSG